MTESGSALSSIAGQVGGVENFLRAVRPAMTCELAKREATAIIEILSRARTLVWLASDRWSMDLEGCFAVDAAGDIVTVDSELDCAA